MLVTMCSGPLTLLLQGPFGGGGEHQQRRRLEQLGDKAVPTCPHLGQRFQNWASVTQVLFLQLNLAFPVDPMFPLESW